MGARVLYGAVQKAQGVYHSEERDHKRVPAVGGLKRLWLKASKQKQISAAGGFLKKLAKRIRTWQECCLR